jgi:hypothetical protein
MRSREEGIYLAWRELAAWMVVHGATGGGKGYWRWVVAEGHGGERKQKRIVCRK